MCKLIIPIMVESGRHTGVLTGQQGKQIEPAFTPLLNKDVILCTDGMRTYKQIARHAKNVHHPINIAAGQRAINNICHIQNVNAYDSRLKQGVAKFQGVATRYLRNYLGWQGRIDRLGQSITPTLFFLASLGQTRQFQQLTTT